MPNNESKPTLATNAAPRCPGVYFFWKNDCPLYIGKSINLRNRIKGHLVLAKTNIKEQKLVKFTTRITWIETAGELGALLKESHLIKTLQPIYNRRLRRHKNLFTYYLQTSHGYSNILIKQLQAVDLEKFSNCFGLFKSHFQAQDRLRELIKQHHLCDILLDSHPRKGPCFSYQLKRCKGACLGKEHSEQFNRRLLISLESLQLLTWPYQQAIAIKEENILKQLTDYHVVDKWCHFATVKDLSEFSLSQLATTESFNRDVYYILLSYLYDKNNKNIILL